MPPPKKRDFGSLYYAYNALPDASVAGALYPSGAPVLLRTTTTPPVILGLFMWEGTWLRLDVGSSQVPLSHASLHAVGGSDPITPSSIGAANTTHTHSFADIAGTLPNAQLTDSGAAAGSYGDASHVLSGTVNNKGVFTSISNVLITPSAIGGVATGDTRLTNARTPTGTASGSLAGSFPSPTIAAGAIGTTELAAGIYNPPRFARVSLAALAVGVTVSVTATWNTAFADTNYTVPMPGVEMAGLTIGLSINLAARTATTATFSVKNIGLVALTTGGFLHVVAVHD